MKNAYPKILFCVLFSAIVSSCKVSKYINQKFPPLTTIDQQVNAIDQNLKHIDSLKPAIGIYVNSEMLSDYLSKELKKQIESSNDENVIIEKLEPTVSFDKQGLILESIFSVAIPEHHAKLEGKLIGLTAISTAQDSLYLHSAFKSLKISKVKFTKKPGLKKRAIAKLLVIVLKNYIDNVNGILLKDPSAMDIGWNGLMTFNPKDMFKNEGTEVSGAITNISRYLKQSSILINKKGISILIELKDEEITNEDVNIETNFGHTQSELNRKFKVFEGKYSGQWEKYFDTQNDTTSITLMIAKKEIAAIFNEGFANGFSLKQKIDIPKNSFDSKMEVKKSKINCEKVRTKFSYPSFNRKDCDRDCKWWNADCHRLELQCNVSEEARARVHDLARETKRIAHQLENETKVAGCKVWKETNNFLNLGRFKGSISGSGKGTMAFSKFKFSDDLSELLFHSSGNVKLKINSALRLRPQDLGYVFLCNSNYDRSIKSDAFANFSNQQSKVSIIASEVSENVILTSKFKPLTYEAKIFPSPLHVYLIDPAMVLQCPVFYSILALGSATGLTAFLAGVDIGSQAELMLLGSTKDEYEIDNTKYLFKPILFSIDGKEDLKSKIYWNTKSIEFSYFGG